MTDVMSYVSGTSDTPLLGKTIGQALDDAAAAWADRPALIDRGTGTRWSWAELRNEADAFAAGLLALGLKPGERIGIWSLNRAEWALTQFAAAKAGLILVTINPAYRLTELEYALNLVGCAALVTATQFKTSDYIGMLNTLAPGLASWIVPLPLVAVVPPPAPPLHAARRIEASNVPAFTAPDWMER